MGGCLMETFPGITTISEDLNLTNRLFFYENFTFTKAIIGFGFDKNI